MSWGRVGALHTGGRGREAGIMYSGLTGARTLYRDPTPCQQADTTENTTYATQLADSKILSHRLDTMLVVDTIIQTYMVVQVASRAVLI